MFIQKIEEKFPVIIRKGKNDAGRTIRFYFNYSETGIKVKYRFSAGKEILTGREVKNQDDINIPAWGVKKVEEF